MGLPIPALGVEERSDEAPSAEARLEIRRAPIRR